MAAVAETSYMTEQVISPRRPLGRLRVRASGGGRASVHDSGGHPILIPPILFPHRSMTRPRVRASGGGASVRDSGSDHSFGRASRRHGAGTGGGAKEVGEGQRGGKGRAIGSHL